MPLLALLSSLSLHGLAFALAEWRAGSTAGAASQTTQVAGAKRLAATVRPLPPSLPAVLPAVPVPVAAGSVRNKPVPAVSPPLPAVASPLAAAVLSPPAVSDSELAPASTSPAPVAAIGTALPADAASPATTTAASSSWPPFALDDYRERLKAAAQRQLRYPEFARRNAWEGTAEVELLLLPGSSEPQLSLVASSGSTLLDREAMAIIRRASASSPPPVAAELQRWRFPIRFSLEDQR